MTSRSGAALHSLGLSTIRGLPAHILIVHAVVVFVPLAALALVAALRPHLARRLGLVLPGLAIVALLSVLAAMNAGGWLQDHVQNTALVQDHTRIAGQLWPFSAAVALLSLVIWWQHGRTAVDAPADEATIVADRGSAVVRVVVGVVAVVVAVGSIVQVVRIGESGSRAAWNNHFSQADNHHD
jgi:hypothetical protein